MTEVLLSTIVHGINVHMITMYIQRKLCKKSKKELGKIQILTLK